ncbi:MAG: SRPBCC family protein [Frankiaceae bacterium]
MPRTRIVSGTVVIAASAETIFDLLANPRAHLAIDGSGTLRGVVRGPARLAKGSHFSVRMRAGVPYVMRNAVVELEEGRRIAWRHIGRHRWRYELRPVEGGTEVTESFDYSTALSPWLLERLGYPERNAAGIERSLQLLKQYVEEPSSRPATG